MDVETQQQHAAIRETVRRFAQDQLLPNALRWDREREFPRQALQELGAMGLFGVTIPEKWGGAELDNTALAIAIEEIAAGDCSTSLIVAVNNIISKILDGFGSQSQKELFLKELASGKINGAFALTEPQAGSDASSISTRAVKVRTMCSTEPSNS
jgi:butyryl-CoA dehydrogenase